MAAWNFATVWDTVAQAHPDRIALAHIARAPGNRRLDWRSMERRAAGVAATLCGAGLGRGDKVALYLHNAPEYLEAAYAAMKAGLVPVNTNYRYVADELLYLWTNADAAAVVFHAAFTATVEALRGRCPAVRLWLHVDDGNGPCPSWAEPYEQAAATPRAAHLISGDDQILIYTGGTTGLPRGVMWRQHDLYLASNASGDAATFDTEAVQARLSGPGPIGLPAAPLMHGTGFVFAATILNRGGTVLTLTEPKFDAHLLLDAIGRERVTDLCIVGDAFCRPMVEALEQEPGRYDLSSLKIVSSSGMMWSPAVKARLLLHAPDVLMIDFLNASEASGLGRSLTSARKQEAGARFRLGENAFVLDDDDRPMPPGTGRPGRLAVRGRVPLGYYKDPVKTAATFPTIGGVRCAVPGDYAIVEADGSITLLGRGSISINTGGEKVFPEEVEEAVKTFPAVRDALVVGVPDLRFGQVVAAVVEPVPGQTVERHALLAYLHGRLAPHKLPRIVMPVDTIGRAPNGKADYRAMAGRVAAWHEPGKE